MTCEGCHLTYGELNRRANHMAHYLWQRGVGPETPVALCLERSLEMIVAILGVLKAGGAYVPIDLAYPKERLAFMLEDSQAPILVTQEKLLPSVPDSSGEVICLDRDWKRISAESKENPKSNASGDNAAYIIFTSGSTGKPKGVQVTHHNVVRLLSQTDHWYGFNASDVWSLFHSYAFDFSVWEIWGALLYGGRLVVVPHLVSRSPSAFYDLLAKEKVTVLNQTPSAFRQLIWAESSSQENKNLSLRYVIFGGEALELQSLRPWFDRHGDERPLLVNMYGITETTVHTTYRPIRIEDVENGLGSVIGVPIPDLTVRLLDDQLREVPQGEPGEIFVGGDGVARGYLNRPELTAQRFIADPFSAKPGARLYRSGDLARYSAEGELEYLGRIDHQVKIRGFRIELGEIEAALNQHPDVRGSTVIASKSQDGDGRLVAYVVPSNGTLSINALREHLAQKIPEYMIPSAFVRMEDLPLTPNGKIDRRALPEPGSSRPEMRVPFVEPRSRTEQILADIWSQVLGIDQVGIHDNFFELGGDSIRSISVLSRSQQRGVHCSLQQLFRTPTIAEIASAADAKPEATANLLEPFCLILPEDRAKLPPDLEDAYPMMQLQVAMFYYNELNPLSAVYHDVFSFRIEAPFDRGCLERAAARLAERHPTLRTSFHISGYSEPMQLVHKTSTIPITVEDLRGENLEEQERKLVAHVDTEKRNAFDRTTPPLLRLHAQQLSDQVFQLVTSFHHVYLDGWSLAALMTELLQDYAALREGSGKTIAPPRLHYREFIALEKSAIASLETRAFWQEKLSGAQIQMLPRWPKAMRKGGHEQVRGPEIEFEENILSGLKHLAQTAGVPLKTVLLAAHQKVMSLLYGQTDVISGLVCNGRPEDIDGEKVIGLHLNTAPLRVQLKPGNWLDLVRQTFAAEQEMLPHRRFPLAEIQQLNGGQPVFEAAFDFVHFHVYKNLEGCRNMGFMEGHYFEANNLTLLTTFMLDITSTQLQMHFDYDPNLLCPEQIREMCGHYANVLAAMAANPKERFDTFSPLSSEEKQRILLQWNATDQGFPRDKCVHELFEAQAARTPEAVAVTFEGKSLTYGQLNGQADAVAAALRDLKVGPETVVGLCAERSPAMVAALLGVLKAGGAYLPLDPGYPRERLAEMISDSKAAVVLASEPLVASLPATGARLMPLEAAVKHCTQDAIGCKSSSSQLAYLLYTSGSTGKPKGTAITHQSVVNLLLAMARRPGFSATDNFLAVTTITFDIAGVELFLPLITGGRITLVSREKAMDGVALSKLVNASEATVMQATPATWRLLLEAGWKGKKGLRIFTAGEALSREMADELLKRCDELWNLYGPTETTIYSTGTRIEPGAEPITIGRPLPNTQVYILDEGLQPVPVGVVGELHIGGIGLAKGYLNRPELTAEKFIPNPFCSERGARLYKTGDLARYLPDGRIECLGRRDHQIKLRGYRIELGEIETVLRQHPNVSEAVAVARQGNNGDKTLVAYVMPKAGQSPTQAELREHLKSRLPDFMVPGACVVLERFPLTSSGKVDRRALPAPECFNDSDSKAIAPPRSPLESEITAIWKEVFQRDNISVEDSFFDLGGHSLIAIQVIVRLRERLGVELPLQSLFAAPTIRALAEVILDLLVTGRAEGELEQALQDTEQPQGVVGVQAQTSVQMDARI